MQSFDFSWMVGGKIEEVRFNEPTQWVFAFDRQAGIGAECPWRLLKDGRALISSEDHQQRYGLPAPLDSAAEAQLALRAQTVTDVEIRDGTADLILQFTGGLRLEVIPISSGYESWGVTSPAGLRVIAQGGGQLCGFAAGA